MSDLLDKSLQEADETLAELISNMPKDKRHSILKELRKCHPDWDMHALIETHSPTNSESSHFERILLNKEDGGKVDQAPNKSNEVTRLTNEEKEFFFGAADSIDSSGNFGLSERSDGVYIAGNEYEVPEEGDVEVGVVEQDAAIYEDLMVSPILKDLEGLLLSKYVRFMHYFGCDGYHWISTITNNSKNGATSTKYLVQRFRLAEV